RHRIEIGGIDRSPVIATDARVDQVDKAATPTRPALFESETTVAAGGKLHRREVAARILEIAPAIASTGHLIHVRKHFTQLAGDGFDVAILPLVSDGADVIRVEHQRIRLKGQRAEGADDEVVRNVAIRLLARALRIAHLKGFLARPATAGGVCRSADL